MESLGVDDNISLLFFFSFFVNGSGKVIWNFTERTTSNLYKIIRQNVAALFAKQPSMIKPTVQLSSFLFILILQTKTKGVTILLYTKKIYLASFNVYYATYVIVYMSCNKSGEHSTSSVTVVVQEFCPICKK